MGAVPKMSRYAVAIHLLLSYLTEHSKNVINLEMGHGQKSNPFDFGVAAACWHFNFVQYHFKSDNSMLCSSKGALPVILQCCPSVSIIKPGWQSHLYEPGVLMHSWLHTPGVWTSHSSTSAQASPSSMSLKPAAQRQRYRHQMQI